MHAVTAADSRPSPWRWSLLAIIVLVLTALLALPAAVVRADDDDDDDGGGATPPTLPDVCLSAAATNLVVNGDFEVGGSTPITTWPTGTGPAPWTVTEPNTSVDQVHASYWAAACGVWSIDLTGSPGQGTLSQTVSGTLAGEQYRLRFAYAANPDPACEGIGEPATVTADVRWGGGDVETLSLPRTPDPDPNTLPPHQPAWQPFEATVSGTGVPTLLEFDSTAGNFCGIAIDAVSLTLVVDDDDGDDDDGDDDEGDDDDDGDDDEGLI